MPILHREPVTYPPNLFGETCGDPAAEQDAIDEAKSPRGWWAIYTRSRREKALARSLHAHQVPFYLPLVKHERLYRGRKVKCYMPLFSGYLFMCGTDDERITALTTKCVSRILPVKDHFGLFRDLLNIHQLIESEAAVTIEQRLQPGQKVRVKSGAFKDMEGIVIERHGRKRLLVAVQYIQQGVSMSIDDFMVEPI